MGGGKPKLFFSCLSLCKVASHLPSERSVSHKVSEAKILKRPVFFDEQKTHAEEPYGLNPMLWDRCVLSEIIKGFLYQKSNYKTCCEHTGWVFLEKLDIIISIRTFQQWVMTHSWDLKINLVDWSQHFVKWYLKFWNEILLLWKKNPHFTLASQIGKTEMNNTHKMLREVNFVTDVTAHRHVNNAVCPPVVPHSWEDPGWRGDRLICPSVLLKEWACREPIKTIANRSSLYITTLVFVPFLGVALEVSIKIIPFSQMRKLRTKEPGNLPNKQQSLETSGHHSTLLLHVTVKGSSLWPWSTAPCLFNCVTVLHERILNKWSRLRSKMGEGEWMPDISLLRSSSSWADTFFFPQPHQKELPCVG